MTPTDSTWLVILAGGIGSRFWPLSRASRPKQLLDLFGDGPMLRVTFERALPLSAPERTLIVTSEALAPAVAALLPELPAENILAEPCGRNTAPAIAWAALVAEARTPGAHLVVLPADHYIPDREAFLHSARAALSAAEGGALLTLGVTPTRPDTGYGYILKGAERADGAFDVARFVEKPDLTTAIAYLAEGTYLWNAGMFFMSAALFLSELRAHAPDLGQAFEALAAGASGAPFAQRVRAAYPALRGVSIDYAVMEKSDRVAVMPAGFAWSDVGAWPALMDHRAPGASSFTKGQVLEVDGGDNVLVADEGLVAVLGVTGLTVVHTPSATLVIPTDKAQRVRELVAALAADGKDALL